jgi:putative nucleotidyltransferase with HDIG domain
MFGEARLGKVMDAEACLPLVHAISDSVIRNPGAMVSLARLKTQDDYTYMHSVAVCALMVALARELGLDEEACRSAGTAGLLHDVGKALMPLDILNKPGKLTDDEFGVMKGHPERGHELLAEARGADAGAMDVCLHHHERVDGSGYPHGLFEDQLSLYARMAAVCDVYAALTAPRAYRAAVDPPIALQWMAQWKSQFDPLVFQALVRAIGIYPVGSLVRLQSGRLAVVVEQNPRSLMAPQVRSFYSARAQVHLEPELIDLSRPHCNERIVQREQAAHWGFKHLDKLWAGDAAVA